MFLIILFWFGVEMQSSDVFLSAISTWTWWSFMALPFVILIFKLINCSERSSTWFFRWSMFWNFEKKIRTCASLDSFAMFVQQARRSKATPAIQSVNVLDWKVSFTKSSRRIHVCRRETKNECFLLFVRNVLNYSALVLDLDSVRWRFLVSNFELDMMIIHGVAIRDSIF